MGGSSKQVTGYRYFANFLLFIGNPIEKVLGINFDKRGWLTPLIDVLKNPLDVGEVNKPSLYGENEGGVVGQIHARYGTANPDPVDFYNSHLAKNDLPPLSYPYQSYLAFKDFYLGNSGYMKEMLLWVKRIHVRNDGREQWYDEKAEVPYYLAGSGSVDPIIAPFQANTLLTVKSTFAVSSGSYPNSINSEDGVVPTAVLGFTGGGGEIGANEETLTYSITMTSGSAAGYLKVTGSAYFICDNYQFGALSGFERLSLNNVVRDGNTTTADIVGIAAFNIGQEIALQAMISTYEGATSFGGNIILNFEWVSHQPTNGMEGDINPIHKIREILTDDTAMNKPESDVNDQNFIKAADRIYDEGLGISWAIDEKSCIDAIEELCYHIEAGIRVNRQTGLYEMVLFRYDWFAEDEIHTIAENKIKDLSLEVMNSDDIVNQLNVSYYDRENIKDASFSISENASIKNMQGRVNAETADFPYFMNQRNAAVVAQWKLKQFTTPCWKGSFTTGYNEARKWNRYDIVKLNWSRKGIADLPVRIMRINLGDGVDNTVSIDFVEVVPFSDELTSTVVVDDRIDTAPLPPQACQYEPFEMPYYLAVMALGQRKVDEELSYENDFGLVGVVAEKPQNNSLYAVMMTNNGDEWERAGSIQYSETADLDQIISRTSSSFTVKNWKKIANVSVGTLIKCGRDWLGTSGEWMVFQGVDPYTGVVSVKRGALDTPPQEWGIDTKLYFCGGDVAYDQTEYIAGEEVLVSALTTTPSGMLENLGSIPLEMKARAIRPYPPANVKFNDAYYPETLVVTNDILLTWMDRNRVQQTGGEILGFYDAGVTKETGVTYSYELISQGIVLDSGANITANSITILSSALLQNQPHTLKLWSVRNGYVSYQIFEHAFFVEAASLILTATATKSQLTGNTVAASGVTVIVDETLTANMLYNGSSITGKAQAGATITINIEE